MNANGLKRIVTSRIIDRTHAQINVATTRDARDRARHGAPDVGDDVERDGGGARRGARARERVGLALALVRLSPSELGVARASADERDDDEGERANERERIDGMGDARATRGGGEPV